MARIICRRLQAILLLLLAACFVGCQSGSLPPASNAELANASLEAALASWKNKEPEETITKRTPPVFFNDAKRKSMTLVSYQIVESHEQFGQSIRFQVKLTLSGQDGASKERTVAYLVDTGPSVVIVPD